MLSLVAGLLLASAPALPDGSYALTIDVVGRRAVPLLGELDSTTTTTSLVALRTVGERRIATNTACAVASSAPLFTSHAPARAVARLPASTFELVLDGRALRASLGTLRMGMAGDVVPSSARDARARDTDADGKPGSAMNVRIAGLGAFELQVAGAWTLQLDGEVRGDGAAGRVRAATQDAVLSGLPLPGKLEPMRVDGARSSFTLRRVRDGARCDDVVTRARGVVGDGTR